MRVFPSRFTWWLAVPLAIALGLAFAVAFDKSSSPARAQSAEGAGFTLSVQQLRINQRISQAAVRRSNRALGAIEVILDRINGIEARLNALDGGGGQEGGQGLVGPGGYERVTNGPQDFGPDGYRWASCPDGKRVIGGGFHENTEASPSSSVAIAGSFPSHPGDVFGTAPDTVEPGEAWVVRPNKPMNVDRGDITVYALCMNAS